MARRSRKQRRAEAPAGATDPDIRVLDGLARGLLVLLIIIAIPRYFELAWEELEIWFPLDEMQHYDVIDAFSSGEFPDQREYVTDYTYQITVDYFGVIPIAEYDGTKESLGVFGLSYESQQPPVYYLLLAGPNYLMKALGVEPPQLIKMLRSFDLLFYLATCVVIVFLFDDLATLAGYPRLFGYFVAALFFVTGFEFRGYISCDHLAPLIGTLAVWLMVLAWRTGRGAYIAWSTLAAALAFLTKYTNGYFLLIWLANTLLIYYRAGRPCIRTMLVHASPFLLIPFYLGTRLWVLGIDGFSQRPELMEFLYAVLGTVGAGEASIELVTQSLPGRLNQFQPWPALIGLCAVGANLLISGRRLVARSDPRALPVFVACVATMLVVASAALLSVFVPGFNLHHFRHYEGYSVLWYAAIFATPLLYDSRRLNIAAACTGLLFVVTLTDLWG